MGKIRLSDAGEVRALSRGLALDTGASLRSMAEGRHTFHFDDRSTVAGPIDIIRWASDHIPHDTRHLHLRNSLLSGVAAAEAHAPGSGPIALAVACELVARAGVVPLVESAAQARRDGLALLSRAQRCGSQEALGVTGGYDLDIVALSISRRALEMCSSNASLSVEVEGERTRVERVEGHSFPCSLAEVFAASARGALRRTLRDPRVLVVDGLVERMSELEGVIGDCHVSRTPLVVFARGFDPDVQNTLGRNHEQVGLQAYPIVVPFDELGANLLNDISVVAGADLVSSLKGELISSRRWDDLRPVASVALSGGRATVVNPSTEGDVRRQRRALREKRTRAISQELELIDRRLRCLMGSGVSVLLGTEMGSLTGIRRDRIGAHARLFRACAHGGIVPLSELPAGPISRALAPLSSRLSWVPAPALATGVRVGLSVAQGICSIGGMIYGDGGDGRQT